MLLSAAMALYALLFHRHVPRALYGWAFGLAYLALLSTTSLTDIDIDMPSPYPYAWLGITAGYHRLWSHRAYEAADSLKIFLACRSFLLSRFTDTEDDPYDSTKASGETDCLPCSDLARFSHIGWLMPPPPSTPAQAGYHQPGRPSQFKDWVVTLQTRYIGMPYFVPGFLMPPFLGWCYGDVLGGTLWAAHRSGAGAVARVFAWNGIWSINSLAHKFGAREYQSDLSAASS